MITYNIITYNNIFFNIKNTPMYICNTGTRAVKWGSLKSYWLIPSWVRIPPSVNPVSSVGRALDF
jgi:hypothetical protein